MNYLGYTGSVHYSEADGCFHGRLMHIHDVIAYEGDTVEGLKQAFRDSVDDYLEFCKSLGQPPNKPFTGTLVTRVSPTLHRLATLAAKNSGMDLNDWVVEQLEAGLATPKRVRLKPSLRKNPRRLKSAVK